MKVFVSSTCYDLVDLRDELRADLADLGVEAMFSDIKESDFLVDAAAATNSIESCLVNVRACDMFILILSQRYGPKLGPLFNDVSATHREYIEARDHKKPTLFYARDRLIADWSSWRRNGKQPDFRPVWAQQKDPQDLFEFLENHQALNNPDGTNRNNWWIPFRTSFDLRADVRRRLLPTAYRESARKLIDAGQVPVVIAGEARLSVEQKAPGFTQCYLLVQIVNLGPVPGMNIETTIDGLVGGLVSGEPAAIPAILANLPAPRINFSFPSPFPDARQTPPKEFEGKVVRLTIHCRYHTATGYQFSDLSDISLVATGSGIQLQAAPRFLLKEILDMKSIVLGQR